MTTAGTSGKDKQSSDRRRPHVHCILDNYYGCILQNNIDYRSIVRSIPSISRGPLAPHRCGASPEDLGGSTSEAKKLAAIRENANYFREELSRQGFKAGKQARLCANKRGQHRVDCFLCDRGVEGFFLGGRKWWDPNSVETFGQIHVRGAIFCLRPISAVAVCFISGIGQNQMSNAVSGWAGEG